MADYSIGLAQPESPANGFSPGDQIRWDNNTGHNISSFTLPSCVSPPQSPAPIADGSQTRVYTINAGSKGSYAYSWIEDDPKRGNRNGTIDVN
jgi:plastocyanin